MIIDIESYQKYLKGFYIYDCTYGYEHGKVGLSLIEVVGNDSNLLIVFYVQIMPDDFVMQLHRF